MAVGQGTRAFRERQKGGKTGGPSKLLLQIALALGLVGLAPLGLTFWSLAEANREAVVDQLLRTHAAVAKAAASRLSEVFADLETSSKSLMDPALSPAELAQAASGALDRLSSRGAVELVLFDGEGRLRLQARVREAPLPELSGVSADRVSAGPMAIWSWEGRTWLRYRASSPSGRAEWLLGLPHDLANWAGLDALGDSAHLLILDEKGALRWGDSEEVKAILPEVLSAVGSANLAEGATRLGTKSAMPRVLAWSSVRGVGWKVISTQPAELAARALLVLERRALLAGASGLGLVLVLSAASWQLLVRPVRRLLALEWRLRGLGEVGPREGELAGLREAIERLEEAEKSREAMDQVFLGRYQVLEWVGAGGMGTVFRGWDPRLQRPVALKTVRLDRDVAGGGPDAGQLLREAIVAAQVHHPNVVTVFDAQVGDGAVVLALEYIEGVTLEELLSRVGKLDWQQVAPLGREIARGLAAAHGKGIVHRDLKPGNVLLSRSGEVKLADFGLAAAYSALPKVSEVVVGTPGYMAPEIFRGEPADFRTDLFALGVLYYRAIVGRLPFDGEDIREIVRATLLGKVQRPREPVPELPIWFEELILELLRPSPEERLSSADRVVEVLDLQVKQLGLSWKLEPFLTQTGLSLSVAAVGKGMPTAKIPLP